MSFLSKFSGKIMTGDPMKGPLPSPVEVKPVEVEPPKPEPMTLIKLLQKGLSGYFPARSHKNLHASDLTKASFCPRQTALLDITKGVKKKEYQETALTATFDIGNAISDLVRERWLGAAAIGDWFCQNCGDVAKFQPRPPQCLNCGFKPMRYQEVRFTSESHGYSGGIDVLVDFGEALLTVVELKIIAPDDFEKLLAPLGEHRVRTNLYLHLVETSQHPHAHRVDTQTARVLYVSRAYGKLHKEYKEILPFKEYVVKREDQDLEGPLAKALQVKRWREQSIIPQGICPTSFCPTAKSCSMIKECWSGKFPGMA